MTEQLLARWAAGLASDLGIDQALDVDQVLDLAAAAAHGVVRPAAPLTTFLVGVAVGRAGGDRTRIAEVLSIVQSAIERWDRGDG